jgi:hypothetical protein
MKSKKLENKFCDAKRSNEVSFLPRYGIRSGQGNNVIIVCQHPNQGVRSLDQGRNRSLRLSVPDALTEARKLRTLALGTCWKTCKYQAWARVADWPDPPQHP